jgi:hypothetical protein
LLFLQVLSVLLCTIALIYLLVRGEGFRHALGFIVVLLVASIPIAIEIVRCVSWRLVSSKGDEA